MSVIISFSISYYYSEEIIYILTKPLNDARLKEDHISKFHFIFTDLTEAFYASLYVSLFITACLLLVACLYQFFLFIQPGLYEYEKKQILSYLILSWFISFTSLIFTYFIILPGVCKFFLSYEINIHTGLQVEIEPKIFTYLSSSIKFFIWFQILLQIPICIFLSIKIGFFVPSDIGTKTILNEITKRRKFIYFIFFLFSGLISPFDCISQMLIMIWFIIVGEANIFLLLLAIYCTATTPAELAYKNANC